jgi:two-component system OmpR family sensor kinase
MPIRTRLTIWYAALLAVVVAAVGLFVVVRLRADLTASIDRNLEPAAEQIALGYHQEGLPEFLDSAASLLAGERAAAQVLAGDGRVLTNWGDPAGRQPLLAAGTAAAATRRPFGPRTVSLSGGGHFRVEAEPVTRFGHRQVVVTAVSTQPVDRSVRRVTTLLLLALPAALIVVAAGGWWLARRALRPIDRMTATAAAIDAGRLEGRVSNPATSDEVGRLATTLNAMLDRVEEGVEEQRRLVADASHELRTPLAAMRSELDVSLRLDGLPPAARRVLESVREEVDAMARTVADLLTLARVDAGELALDREPVDLQATALEVASSLAPLATDHRVELHVGGQPAKALADSAALRQVVRNLVENAIEFSPDGGCVQLRTDMVNGCARLTVLDDGPGVASDVRERVFERFYRADPSRSRRTGGSGLGLAIARELTEAQGGRVWIEDREGRGAAFIVELER